MAGGRLSELRDHLRQRPVMMALLAGLAVIFFGGDRVVTGIPGTA